MRSDYFYRLALSHQINYSLMRKDTKFNFWYYEVSLIATDSK